MEIKRLDAKAACDLLLSVERPLVVTHLRPDGDTLGSATALVRILRALGRPAVFTTPDPIAERLEFIYRKDELATDTEGYTPIAIDVASPSQLGGLKDTLGEVALMIDHHAVGQPFAPYYTVPEASSAAEALMDILDELCARGLIGLNADIAAPIYTAMSSDTGGFCFSNATAKTHRRAAELIDTGIDAADINHRRFYTKSRERLLADGYIASKIKTEADGRVAYATVTEEEMRSLGLSAEKFECAIDVIRSLAGAEIAIFIRQVGEGEYKASMRSVGMNVAEIAAHFGGGGHIRASGCTIKDEDIDRACTSLISEVLKLYK